MKFSRRNFLSYFVSVSGAALVTPLAAKSIPSFGVGPIHSGKQDVNILDFGARNDKGYDNYQHIQRAIDSIKESGGRVYVPAGVYDISLSRINNKDEPGLKLYSNVELYGDSEQESILSFLGETTARTHILRNADFESGNENISIRDLTIECNYKGTKGQEDRRINAITFKNSSRCSCVRVKCLNGHGYGIWLSNSNNSRITNCEVRDFQDGIELSDGASYNIVDKNKVYSTGNVHYISSLIICFANANYNYIVSNYLSGGAGQALSVVSGYGHGNDNVFLLNNIDVYNTVGVYMSGSGNQIISNTIKTKAQPAILFYAESGSQNTLLINNRLFSDLQNSPPSRKSVVVFKAHDKNFTAKSNDIYYVAGEAFPKSASKRLYEVNDIYRNKEWR